MRARDHIDNARPLLTIDTPLKRIPDFWRRQIEPRIERPSGSTCWFWVGALNHRGEPTIKYRVVDRKYSPTEIKRPIAKLFWDVEKHWEILHACGNTNCLNPRHFYVTALSWQQHDREKIMYELRRNIRGYSLEKGRQI